MDENKKIDYELEIDNMSTGIEEDNDEINTDNIWVIQRLREKKFIKLSNYLLFFSLILLVILAIIYGSVLFLNTKINPNFQLEEGSIKYYAKNLGEVFLRMIGYVSRNANERNICSQLKDIVKNGKQIDVNNINKKIENCIKSKQVNIIIKRNILHELVNNLFSEYEKNKKIISKTKEDIARYAFLPKQIDDLIYGGDIADLLVTVEGIRLSAFLRLYKFVKPLRELLVSSIGGALSEQGINKFLDIYVFPRGDTIIKKFLIDCYFNPFVISSDSSKCTSIVGTNDFADFLIRNFRFSSDKIRTIQLILGRTIDNIINSSKGTNLNIVFNNLDPQKKTISFKTEVITYKRMGSNYENEIDIPKDKSSLLVYGDEIDPHIFLSTTFINLLRESHFILGDNINIDSLKVDKRKLKDMNNIIANISSFNFNVKLQPSVVREIYDFVYGK